MHTMEYYIEQMREKLNANLQLEYSNDFKKVTVNYYTESGQLVTSGCLDESAACTLLENILLKHKQKVKRLNVDISLYLHNELKRKCLADNITMKQALESMIRKHVND